MNYIGSSKNRYQVEEYIGRINKVIDYIETHLDQELTLEKLADIAKFSKFHFHRIFYSIVHETLFQFIQRLRLERASLLLVNDPKSSITNIALKSGFSNSAAFARSFKNQFGISASEWREKKDSSNSSMMDSKTSETGRNMGKESTSASMYIDPLSYLLTWRTTMKKVETQVEVKELPQMTIAYVRHIGPYAGDGQLFERLFNKLFAWAGPRNLLLFPETKTVAIYHDDPELTDKQKLRVSVGISVPEDTKVDGEVGKLTLTGGKYAIGRFTLANGEYSDAWSFMYGVWLPKSGYTATDDCAFEMYPEPAKEDGACVVDICIPVKPL